MATDAIKLPEGFVLDSAPTGLPKGFVLDEQKPKWQPTQTYGEAKQAGKQYQVGGDVTLNEITAPETQGRSAVGRLADWYAQQVDITKGGAEAIASMATGAAAYTPAQMAGGIQMYANREQPLAGPDARDTVQSGLTYEPRTETGKRYVQNIGETMQPVAELENSMRFHEEAREAGAPEWLQRNAAMVPEMAGMVLAGAPTPKIPKTIKNAINNASPSLSKLKTTATSLFKKVDDMGVTIKDSAYTSLIDDIYKQMTKHGVDQQVTPKAFGVMERLYSEGGKPMKLSDINTMREVAKGAAKSIDKKEAMLGTIAINKIDEFLESLTPEQMITGANNANKVGVTYRKARNQWGRYRRAEMIDQAVEVASVARSGWENGIRQEMTNLLKRIKKGKEKGFQAHEIAAMEKVANGTAGANTFRELGKMGVGFGQLGNNWLGAFLTGGAAYTLGGPVAMIAAVGGGTAFKKISEILTKANANHASALIRAGKDAKKITAAYNQMVPAAARSADDLSMLLLHSDIDLKGFKPPNPLEAKAVTMAAERQVRIAAMLTAASSEDYGEPVVKNGQYQIGN